MASRKRARDDDAPDALDDDAPDSSEEETWKPRRFRCAHAGNEEVVRVLRELAWLVSTSEVERRRPSSRRDASSSTSSGTNLASIKGRAYEAGAHAVALVPFSVTDRRQLDGVEGATKAIKDIAADVLSTGTCSKLEALRREAAEAKESKHSPHRKKRTPKHTFGGARGPLTRRATRRPSVSEPCSSPWTTSGPDTRSCQPPSAPRSSA